MKVRIGAGFSGWPFPTMDPAYLWEYIDASEDLGLDSIWLADRIVSSAISMESMTFMSAVAARTKKMKFGNSVLSLPLRNPAVLAKEIATVDFLSGGRMLPAVGLGTDSPNEYEACGVEMRQRGPRTDEFITLMRRLWEEESVTFEGRFYRTTEVTVTPKPHQQPVPVWIGGRTEAACRRVGRMGDGWLTSFLSPPEVGQGIQWARQYAAEAGRQVPEDHYGIIVSYCFADSQDEAAELAKPYMFRVRQDLPPPAYCGLGSSEDIVGLINEYVAQGATKFVLRPCCPPEQTLAQNEKLARAVAPVFHGT